jgi:hypothetical protein
MSFLDDQCARRRMFVIIIIIMFTRREQRSNIVVIILIYYLSAFDVYPNQESGFLFRNRVIRTRILLAHDYEIQNENYEIEVATVMQLIDNTRADPS